MKRLRGHDDDDADGAAKAMITKLRRELTASRDVAKFVSDLPGASIYAVNTVARNVAHLHANLENAAVRCGGILDMFFHQTRLALQSNFALWQQRASILQQFTNQFKDSLYRPAPNPDLASSGTEDDHYVYTNCATVQPDTVRVSMQPQWTDRHMVSTCHGMLLCNGRPWQPNFVVQVVGNTLVPVKHRGRRILLDTNLRPISVKLVTPIVTSIPFPFRASNDGITRFEWKMPSVLPQRLVFAAELCCATRHARLALVYYPYSARRLIDHQKNAM